ncbi:hypothetical protein KIMH_10400 [Bombiscardovia apis]|uniref:DUF4381 domain-containing protein n=1 Tax=Bombiscardovia apis TaxID=2932182 RepID=A0ABM8BDF2_9BIFI|nr:hypothetical protein [Bombiscardovia apis]BDR54929.1 hypothetical protein KIMH_10400 [Bombiscardovia apis]
MTNTAIMNTAFTLHVQLHQALTVPKGSVLPPLSSANLFVVVALGAVLLAVALIVVVVVLSKPRKAAPAPQARHIPSANRSKWYKRIDGVVKQHQAGQVSQAEAMSQLAEIVRQFASQATGTDLSTHTLAELSQQTRTASNREQLDLLRQTISALYPPEFADPAVNRQAYEAQVSEAAQWVSTLVERWK